MCLYFVTNTFYLAVQHQAENFEEGFVFRGASWYLSISNKWEMFWKSETDVEATLTQLLKGHVHMLGCGALETKRHNYN